MNHGRFTECCFLRSIGRDVLTEFFQSFESEMAAKGLVLPSDAVSDDDFFANLSRILMSPEGLPDRVNEVLHEIQELSTEAGHERLKKAIGQSGLQLSMDLDATPEETALQVWLHSPELLVKQYSEHRFTKLKAFGYFERGAEGLPLFRDTEKRGNEEILVAQLDAWFSDHGRGRETTVVEKFELNGEEWYLIRHGDTYLRSSKIANRKVEVVHYRPAKDDLVVYNAKRDELRINAKTKGERELYRNAFGQFLHGLESYFEESKTYSLEPLRQFGAEALECHDIPGLRKVVLTQLELELAAGRNQRKRLEADDVFACSWSEDPHGARGLELPENAVLTEAAFHVYVGGAPKPIEIRIKLPNLIRVGNQAAVSYVQDWLAARGFKAPPCEVAA